MTLKELMELRAKAIADARALNEKVAKENREFTAEEQSQWDGLDKQINDLKVKIDRAKRLDDLEADSRQPVLPNGVTREELLRDAAAQRQPLDGRPDGPTEQDRLLAFRAWAMGNSSVGYDDHVIAACHRLKLNPAVREMDVPLFDGTRLERFLRTAHMTHEQRVDYYASTAATYGGETIPEGFVYAFEEALLWYGPMRQVATILRTAQGNNMPYPTTNDTSNEGAQIAEVTDSTDSAFAEQTITTSSITLLAWMLYSKMIKVSHKLMQDSAFDVASYLGRAAGERVGRYLNRQATLGVGTTTLYGIVPASTLGVTAASGTTFTMDELIDLEHSVDPAYRQQGASFMMHDTIVKIARKLKDTTNQYLWQPSNQAGVPDSLHTYPVLVNNHMATVANSAKIIVFGALKKYLIREVASMRLRRLVERYAEYDQEAFVALQEFDGNLLDAGTRPVKYLQLAAS